MATPQRHLLGVGGLAAQEASEQVPGPTEVFSSQRHSCSLLEETPCPTVPSSPAVSSYVCLEGFCLYSVAASKACGWQAAHSLKRRNPQQAGRGWAFPLVFCGQMGPSPPDQAA